MNTSSNLDGTDEVMPLADDNETAPGAPLLDDEEGDGEEATDIKDVPLSEEFQSRALDLVKGATKDELAFIRDQCFKCEQEMDKPEVSTDDYDKAKSDE